MNNKLRWFGFVLLAALMVSALCGARAIDRTIAKVNDTILTESDLAGVIATAKGIHHPGQIDAFAEATSETVTSMLDRALLLQEARRLGIRPPNEDLHREVEDMVREIRASFSTEAEFHHTLAAERISLNELKEELLEQTRDDFMVYHVVNSQFSISETELERMKMEGGLSQEPSYRIYRLGVQVKKNEGAEAACRKVHGLVAKSITEGISFEEAVRKYSEVPGAAEDGGDMGYVQLDSLSQSVRAAVEGLEVGQASAPVIAGEYANIFYVAGRRGERVALREQKFISTRADLLKSLRRRATIQVYDERLMPLLVPEYRSQVGTAPRGVQTGATPVTPATASFATHTPGASSPNLINAVEGTPATAAPAHQLQQTPAPAGQVNYPQQPPPYPQGTPAPQHYQQQTQNPQYAPQQTPATRRPFWGFRRNH